MMGKSPSALQNAFQTWRPIAGMIWNDVHEVLLFHCSRVGIGDILLCVTPRLLTRPFLFAARLASMFLVLGVSYATEDRTLAQVCAAHGASEETNTMLHATERVPNRYGRIFSMFRGNTNNAVIMDNLWRALANTKFIETRTQEPKEPLVFIVLNTGMSSKMTPVEEIWITADGLLHFIPDHAKSPREFMVFSGPEVAAWANDNMKEYGR